MAAALRESPDRLVNKGDKETTQSHRRSNSDPKDIKQAHSDSLANIPDRYLSNISKNLYPYGSKNSKINISNSSQASTLKDDNQHSHSNNHDSGNKKRGRRYDNQVQRSQSWYGSHKMKPSTTHHKLRTHSQQALEEVRSMLNELNDEIQNGFNSITFTQVMDAMISELRNCLQLCQDEYKRGSNQLPYAVNSSQQQHSERSTQGRTSEKRIDGIYRIVKPRRLNSTNQPTPYDHDIHDGKEHEEHLYNNTRRRHSLPEFQSSATNNINFKEDYLNRRFNQDDRIYKHAIFTLRQEEEQGNEDFSNSHDRNRTLDDNIASFNQRNDYTMHTTDKVNHDRIEEIAMLRRELETTTTRLLNIQSEYAILKSQNETLKSLSEKRNSVHSPSKRDASIQVSIYDMTDKEQLTMEASGYQGKRKIIKQESISSNDNDRRDSMQSSDVPDEKWEVTNYEEEISFIAPKDLGFTVEGEYIIKSVEKDSEAENFGLSVGDKLKAINGQKIHNMSISSVEKLLKKNRKHLTLALTKKITQLNQSKPTNTQNYAVNNITVLVDQYSSYSDSGDSVSHGIYGSNLSLDSLNSIVSASQLSAQNGETNLAPDNSKLNRKKSNSLTASGRIRLSKYRRHRAVSESNLVQIDGTTQRSNSTGNLSNNGSLITDEQYLTEFATSTEEIRVESIQVHRSLSETGNLQKNLSNDDFSSLQRAHTSDGTTFKRSKISNQLIAKLEDKSKFQKYLFDAFDTNNLSMLGFENSVKAGILSGIYGDGDLRTYNIDKESNSIFPGFQVMPQNNGLVYISSVSAGSAAWQQGILCGDKLLMINGVPIIKYTRQDLFTLLNTTSLLKITVIEKHFKITINGGNKVGLFVTEVDKSASLAGIAVGDRIIECAGINTRGATREEMEIIFNSRENSPLATVVQNYSNYSNMLINKPWDDVYVRALSGYTAKTAKELSFQAEQILHIIDTFVGNRLGYWKASIVEIDNGDGKPALVPSSTDLSMQRTEVGKIEIVIDAHESNDLNGSNRKNSDDSIQSSFSIEEGDDLSITTESSKIVRGSAKNKSKIWGKMKKTLKPKKLLSSSNSAPEKSTTIDDLKIEEILPVKDSVLSPPSKICYTRLVRQQCCYQRPVMLLGPLAHMFSDGLLKVHAIFVFDEATLDRLINVSIHPIVLYLEFRSTNDILRIDGSISEEEAATMIEKSLGWLKSHKNKISGSVQINGTYPQTLDVVSSKIKEMQKRKVWIDWTVDHTSHYDPLYDIGKVSKTESAEQESVDLATENINTTEL
ncbi:uncharacterized protein TRIADDRAFT_55757 [Trichoplax adhaerens]|uniref:PDZ domain-containing protein n=1 Tax=Trichoplax adhaerens TaxID=10228 RepID=B3RVS4_TRIAD|nr:predicted protein [Trichoplax adhaerens]EDV26049.1 predicted protein [Trichoplax adhaerens]|eukprot:XP_002112082.1 predicted protein [Trichoplax adhaerens]